MDQHEPEFTSIEVTHQSLGGQIKFATNPILRQFAGLSALLVKKKKMAPQETA